MKIWRDLRWRRVCAPAFPEQTKGLNGSTVVGCESGGKFSPIHTVKGGQIHCELCIDVYPGSALC